MWRVFQSGFGEDCSSASIGLLPAVMEEILFFLVTYPSPNQIGVIRWLFFWLNNSLQVCDRLSLFRAVCLLSFITILFIKESQYTKFNGAIYNYMLVFSVCLLNKTSVLKFCRVAFHLFNSNDITLITRFNLDW